MDVLIDRLIDYVVENLWVSLVFWRTTAIILFILSVLAFTFRNNILKLLQKETIKSCDKAKFTESDQILNERQLTEFIETLGTNRCYYGQSRRAEGFVHFFREIGNQYLDRGLRKSCTKFIDKLEELLVFTATHFFTYPNKQQTENIDQVQAALYPEILHGSPEAPGYQHAIECQKKLHSILDDVTPLHKKYRALVKNKLFI